VFPLNVHGVDPNPEGSMTGAVPHGGAASTDTPHAPAANSAASDPANPANSPHPANSPLLQVMQAGAQNGSLNRDFSNADMLAAATGGRAFYSTNDLTGALQDATLDGGNYYTLTYSPPDNRDDGKCHNIVVGVKGKYQLAYRRYYCRIPLVSGEDNEGQATAKSSGTSVTIPLKAGDVLQANMKLGAPMLHDLIFSAHVRTQGAPRMATANEMEQLEEQPAFFHTQRRNRPLKPPAPIKIQTYVVDYRVLDPQLKMEEQSGRQATLEFAVAAFGLDGKVQNGVVNDALPDTSSQGDANKSSVYRVRQTLDVPVRAVSIRVGVRDKLSDRLGALELPLPLAPEPVAQARPAQKTP